MRRAGRPTVMAIALFAILVPAAPGAGARTPSLTRVDFILNWLPNVEFAGLWAAQEKGWWRQSGIDMTFKGWRPA